MGGNHHFQGSHLGWTGRCVALVLLYMIAAKFGLALAFERSGVSPVWPPAGVALVGLLILGWRAWPAIALAAFTVNLGIWLTNTPVPVAVRMVVAAAIACGVSMQAVTGWWLCENWLAPRRNHPWRQPMFDAINCFQFGLVALGVALISSAVGPVALGLAGIVEWSEFRTVWLTWWAGDATGILLVAPLLLAWLQPVRLRREPWYWLEVMAVFGVLAGLMLMMYGPWHGRRPLPYTTMAPLVWIAVRLGPRVTVTAVVALAGITVQQTLHGHGPFAYADESRSLLLVLAYIWTVAIMGYALESTVAARRRAEVSLQQLTDQLEGRVERSSLRLRGQEERFVHFMRHLPGVAFIKDRRGRYQYVSDKSEGFFGRAGHYCVGKTDDEVLPPALAAQFKRHDGEVLASGEPMQTVETTVDDEGPHYWLVTRFGIPDPPRRPHVVAGVAVDITDRQRAEQALEASEQQLRTIMNTASEAIILVNQAGLITGWNPAAEVIFGYPENEVLGETPARLLPAHCHAIYQDWLRRRDLTKITTKLEHPMELQGLRKNGEEFPAEVSLSTWETAGKLTFAIFLRDITGRKRTEDEMRHSEERFRGLLDTAPDAMVIADQRGRIVLANAQTERLFGYGRAELVGQPVEILVPERFRGMHVNYRQGYFAQPRARAMGVGLELFGRRKDGSEFPVEVSLSPLETKEGILVSSAIRDITERRRAEVELNRTVAELARSNSELGQFAYVASHDLQEPLRAISGCVEILRHDYQGRLGGDADQLMTHAVEGAQRMQTLIRDLLAYARVGLHGEPFQRTDSNKSLEQAIRHLEEEIAASAAVITHETLPVLLVDPSQLVQLFENLVGNGIKFRSGRRPEVHVSAEAQDGGWKFAVRDNGIGIEPQYLKRIFVIFQRLHTRTEYPGTGVGLAICKRIVERHHGQISVESTPGVGSTFYFFIPDLSKL